LGRFISCTSKPADAFEQRDGKLAAQMLAESLKAVQNEKRLARIGVPISSVAHRSKPSFQEAKDAFGGGRVEKTQVARINCVSAIPIATASPMPDFVFRELFELVRGPVAESSGGPIQFKWVAGRGDVLQMKISATLDEALHGLRVEFTEPGGHRLRRSKKSRSRISATLTASA